jgi:hypothetical protein
MKSIIYDYETLSLNMFNAVVVNLAAIHFDDKRFVENPYEYEELLASAHFIKFDVEEQVTKYEREISKDTLEWWDKQPSDVRAQLKPCSIDQSIDKVYDFFYNTLMIQDCDRVYTRGNTYDPIITISLHRSIGKEDPTKWWNVRDTRSMFEGMFYGHDMKNNFIPNELKAKFIAHDPVHDIAMDIMRFQFLARTLLC